jgi:site-specific recombinase XerD
VEEEQSLKAWIENLRPQNTSKAYRPYVREYLEYAQRMGFDAQSSVTVASFMKHSVTNRDRKVSRSTACTVIPAAISHLFRYSTHSPTDSILVQETKRAITRSTEPPKQGRRPLTLKHLKKIGSLMSESEEDIRNFFMLLLMVTAMLRESEVVQLRADDVKCLQEEGRRMLSVLICRAKTDQGALGNTILLSESMDRMLCVVSWYEKFSGVRSPEAEYLFHQLGTKRDLSKPMSARTPNHIVKKCMVRGGFDPTQFGSHSCRKGGCTAAVEAGVPLRLVARHGRWKSDAVNAYINDSTPKKLLVSQKMMEGKNSE